MWVTIPGLCFGHHGGQSLFHGSCVMPPRWLICIMCHYPVLPFRLGRVALLIVGRLSRQSTTQGGRLDLQPLLWRTPFPRKTWLAPLGAVFPRQRRLPRLVVEHVLGLQRWGDVPPLIDLHPCARGFVRPAVPGDGSWAVPVERSAGAGVTEMGAGVVRVTVGLGSR